jgi:hypothetical protein
MGRYVAVEAETLAAWFTFAAVFVALGISVEPLVWRWRTRPQLTIIFGDEPPLLILEPSATNPQVQIVRVRVTNTGKRVATNVRAQTSNFWFRPAAQERGWEPSLIDIPIWHTWLSRSHDSPNDAEHIDLATGISDYVEVCAKDQTDSLDGLDHWLKGQGTKSVNDRLLDRMARIGEYRLEVTVFSDNTEPVRNVLSYRKSAAARQFGDLKPSVAPLVPPQPSSGNLAAVFKEVLPE